MEMKNYKEYMEEAQVVLKREYGGDMVRHAKAQEHVHAISCSLIMLDVLKAIQESKSENVKEIVEKATSEITKAIAETKVVTEPVKEVKETTLKKK